jgi:DNA-binding transcriptional ArsR family regulator
MPAGLVMVRAMAHPLRLRLLEIFAERPCTTKQAAERLGEAPTRLYHHVAALERAGLVRLRETRPVRGATEKYFETVRSRLEPGDVLGHAGAERDYEAMSVALFDPARAELVKALAAGKKPETLIAVRGVYRLTPGGARRLAKALGAVLRRRKRQSVARPRGRTRRYTLTIAFLPADEDAPSR